jgi:hypothetical protein
MGFQLFSPFSDQESSECLKLGEGKSVCRLTKANNSRCLKAEFKRGRAHRLRKKICLLKPRQQRSYQVNMNKLTHTDIDAPEELSPEEMSALTGGGGFRYLPPDPCLQSQPVQLPPNDVDTGRSAERTI